MVGHVCTGSQANQLCQALRTNQTLVGVNCNGRIWNTGPCGNGLELNAQDSNGDCSCHPSVRASATPTGAASTGQPATV